MNFKYIFIEDASNMWLMIARWWRVDMTWPRWTMCKGEGQERVLVPRSLSNGEGQVEFELDGPMKAMKSHGLPSVKLCWSSKMKRWLENEKCLKIKWIEISQVIGSRRVCSKRNKCCKSKKGNEKRSARFNTTSSRSDLFKIYVSWV